jgi:uncharacterized membrane protein
VDHEGGTGRLEAFSDGVFAIAVTLLILDIRLPLPDTLRPGETLWAATTHAWPSYLAFATSFATLLIVWVNHHNIFRLIRRTDHTLLLLNGLLLFTVTIIPFPTAVLADYLRAPGARTAALLYAGSFLALALAFHALWRYAAHDGRLLAPAADPRLIRMIDRQFRLGPLPYVVCVGVAALNALAGFALVVALAVYWALPEQVRPGPGHGDARRGQQ